MAEGGIRYNYTFSDGGAAQGFSGIPVTTAEHEELWTSGAEFVSITNVGSDTLLFVLYPTSREVPAYPTFTDTAQIISLGAGETFSDTFVANGALMKAASTSTRVKIYTSR